MVDSDRPLSWTLLELSGKPCYMLNEISSVMGTVLEITIFPEQ